MEEFEIVDSESASLVSEQLDLIKPHVIIHQLDDLTFGEGHGQMYNFLIYKFFEGEKHIWARSYLHDISEVSIFGPFRSEVDLVEVESPEFFSKVLAYFKRRYFIINRFSAEFDTGYRLIWRSDSQ